MIDWQLFATVATPVLTLLVGFWLNRRFDSRPILLSHWGHVSSFNVQNETGSMGTVNTHSVVVRNAGRRPATNVRLSHNYLPNYRIWPAIQHRLEEVPNSGKEIVIPTMVPNEQLTISYLYFPPVIYSEINAGVKCDEGIATPIPVLLQRQYPRWFNNFRVALTLVGLSALAYGFFELASWIMDAISA